ncbi:hypothetical protein WN55_00714 [Dufourea novaeangliae]|uniref:Uncharacterized protein n=2 Tax=Dufourea novaeangliae TaxID=178035 RepID=A0A154NY92_DUFNO|nr:hypothetical protein WN55_00714 [Dufourea novaeangliae]
MYKKYECTWTKVVFDSVSFSLRSLSADSFEDSVFMKVPKPWNVNKLMNGLEETLLFTCIVQTNECGIQKHVLEKAVIIKASREIVYEAHSTPVDVSGTKLPKILTVVSVLPDILKKFRDFRICEGIVTDISLDYTQDNTDLKRDIYSNLRHKNCSVLSINRKRCTACNRYSKGLFQRIRRMKNRKSIQRITNSVRLLDDMKLKALKNKMKFRAVNVSRVKSRYQLLKDSLENQRKNVANVTTDALQKMSNN